MEDPRAIMQLSMQSRTCDRGSIRNQLYNSEINRTCVIVVKLLWKSHFVHDYGNVRSSMETLKQFFFLKSSRGTIFSTIYFLKIISHVI